MAEFVCYVIETKTNNFYVGVTTNMSARTRVHQYSTTGWVALHGGFLRVVEAIALPEGCTRTEARLFERGQIRELAEKYPTKMIGGAGKRYRWYRAAMTTEAFPFGTTIHHSTHKRLLAHCRQHGLQVWAFVNRALQHELDRVDGSPCPASAEGQQK